MPALGRLEPVRSMRFGGQHGAISHPEPASGPSRQTRRHGRRRGIGDVDEADKVPYPGYLIDVQIGGICAASVATVNIGILRAQAAETGAGQAVRLLSRQREPPAGHRPSQTRRYVVRSPCRQRRLSVDQAAASFPPLFLQTAIPLEQRQSWVESVLSGIASAPSVKTRNRSNSRSVKRKISGFIT